MTLLHSLLGHLPHLLLETLAYFVGGRIYARQAGSLSASLATVDRLTVLACALVGALVGSKLLHVAEHLQYLLAQQGWELWLAGKSVLGGFLGGTVGVELGKRLINWKASTGDAWVPALTVGLIIGRLGCQLSGTWDQTYGNPTTLPWAWDYGDGVGRHPTALYEIVLVSLLYVAVRFRGPAAPGAKFALYLAGYCGIRFVLEFVKPPFGPVAPDTLPVTVLAGLSAIQWVALLGGLGYLLLAHHRCKHKQELTRI